MLVTKEFTFDAAHYLPNYYGKCENLHGHTYRLQVTVEGPVLSNGMVVDFVLLKHIVKERILNNVDHRCLNDQFPNPTTELICIWIWDELNDITTLMEKALKDPNLKTELKQYVKEPVDSIQKREIPTKLKLHEIKLWETATSFATYSGT